MDYLAQYTSGSDSDGGESCEFGKMGNTSRRKINAAPEVEVEVVHSNFLMPKETTLALNLPVSATMAPVMGPENPYTRHSIQTQASSGKKLPTGGVVEEAGIECVEFDEKFLTYNHLGRSGEDGDTVFTQKKPKRRRKEKWESNLGTQADGIWAPIKENEPVSDGEQVITTEEQERLLAEREERLEKKKEAEAEAEFDKLVERKRGHLLPARLEAGQEARDVKTTWHGGEEFDYQGRSWIEPPSTLKRDDGDHKCYIPKDCIHKWTGHSKGVQQIEFFPRYGNLLLSGSLDSKVKIWDVHNERKCRRTYSGHTSAVRGINFNNDGTRFLSCSFDRYVRLWDTETGKCMQTFTNRRVPYCIKFYPRNNNTFVIGDSNNMIVAFDCNSGDIVQEYNHHLQAVNSVTFVEEGRKFVSTSDDKKILVWEWDIPVPIKYISEPSMHSMPAVALHPSELFFAGQSLNNQIDVYSAKDKFKLLRNKVFKGHTNAGYACQIGFSPNGQFIMSGDGEGRVFFWDWKSTKMHRKLKAHDRGPCMGVIWHPLNGNRVATCGWDGLIKYWD